LINATQLNTGNLTIQINNQFSKCKEVTAIPKQIDNQLYALLSSQSTCDNTNKIIIGVSVGVGGFLIITALIFVLFFFNSKIRSICHGSQYRGGDANASIERGPSRK